MIGGPAYRALTDSPQRFSPLTSILTIDAEALLILGAIAALADVAGGLVLVRARGVERYLRYFVALGAGFLMATALLEMTPESLRLNPRLGPALIMAGYCAVHLLEHTINAHFHFGEETHARRVRLRAHGLLGAGRPERARAL